MSLLLKINDNSFLIWKNLAQRISLQAGNMQDGREKRQKYIQILLLNPFPTKENLKKYQTENRWTLLTENRVLYTQLLAGETAPAHILCATVTMNNKGPDQG